MAFKMLIFAHGTPIKMCKLNGNFEKNEDTFYSGNKMAKLRTKKY